MIFDIRMPDERAHPHLSVCDRHPLKARDPVDIDDVFHIDRPDREQRNEALPTREHLRLAPRQKREGLRHTSRSMQVERRRLH